MHNWTFICLGKFKILKGNLDSMKQHLKEPKFIGKLQDAIEKKLVDVKGFI